MDNTNVALTNDTIMYESYSSEKHSRNTWSYSTMIVTINYQVKG
jgi:hypothetical protein